LHSEQLEQQRRITQVDNRAMPGITSVTIHGTLAWIIHEKAKNIEHICSLHNVSITWMPSVKYI